MLQFLQRPYVFAFVLALATAVLVWLYTKTIEKDAEKVNRTFFKTLAAGVLAGAALTWASSPRAEPVAAEPFDADISGI